MEKQLSMDCLPEGESARVLHVGGEAAMRRRLMDLGLIPGTSVTCRGRAPAGDPGAYSFLGCVVALRSRDAAAVALTQEEAL
ncbi:FeoA family protein [Intestinimonas sp. HCP28S3_D6]|uniref:FeoA family protein n=1 Tax=Intestinimonas sp. HCP28S3_D6 TaxID=3438942 RepID=UPI003F8B617B